MKASLGLFLLCFFFAVSVGAGSSSLCDLPWTDAWLFWTQDGLKAPQIDRNLNGNPLSVGGEKLARGIAGHTQFSAFWNLSGLADSLSFSVGVEDEDDPKDPPGLRDADVVFIALVDRKEVFRARKSLGEKPLQAVLDLKGASQVELRGESGRSGFVKQRVVFGDPVVSFSCREKELKDALAAWRSRLQEQKEFKPASPAAPAWTSIKVEKAPFRSFPEAFYFSTGAAELVVVPNFGGMILSWRLAGSENVVSAFNNSIDSICFERGLAKDAGGHFNRFQPRNYYLPPDPLLLYGPYAIEFPEEGLVRLRSLESAYLFLQQSYEIRLKPGSAELELANVQRNAGPFAQRCGVWSITRLESGLVKSIEVPAEPSSPPAGRRFRKPAEWTEPLRRSPSGWDLLPVSKAQLDKLGRGAVEWMQWPSEPRFRVALADCVFAKSFQMEPEDASFMDAFPPAHVYVSPLFTEIEAHGPTKLLAPGEAITFKESWSLSPAPAPAPSAPRP